MSQRVGGDQLTQGAFPKWQAFPRSALHRTCGGDLALSGGTSSPAYPRSHEMDVANGMEGWGPHGPRRKRGRAAPLSSPFHHLLTITPRAPALPPLLGSTHVYCTRPGVPVV
ncbi:hypothetical protein BU15DRAFT_81677 [Melanogaster broomeanus]|nr:hypothetical protein BU15DRAFT_81677 [Melanogaster broomeanus]